MATVYVEVLTVINLSTVNSVIDIIIKQVALASVAKVSVFYAAAISENAKMKQSGVKPIEVTMYRANKINIVYRED